MTSVVSSLHPANLPIVVQDRRRRGFFTIDNEVNMKDRKFVIRTSLDKLQPFIELYGK
jgi:hypothetical protein